MKNALKNYRDPVEQFVDNLFDWGDNVGKFFEDIPKTFDYPMFRAVKSVGHVNLSSDEKEYKVEILAPGFNKDELNIELKDGLLSIKGEQSIEKTDEDKNYSRKEFCRNAFQRSFKVPTNITGEVDAKFENGVISINLKKKELPPKEEPKKIEIR
jgi:HSP20 family protein